MNTNLSHDGIQFCISKNLLCGLVIFTITHFKVLLESPIKCYILSFISIVDGTCKNTDIRLVGRKSNLEGRVEVCFQGQWGTVCGLSWDWRDASVACRQLGLTSECKLTTS